MFPPLSWWHGKIFFDWADFFKSCLFYASIVWMVPWIIHGFIIFEKILNYTSILTIFSAVFSVNLKDWVLKTLLDQPSLGFSELICSCVAWFHWVFQPLITIHPQQKQAHCWGIRPACLCVCMWWWEKASGCFFQQCWSDLWWLFLGLPSNANLLGEPWDGPHHKSTTSPSSDKWEKCYHYTNHCCPPLLNVSSS